MTYDRDFEQKVNIEGHIRVLIVDDLDQVRQGLSTVLVLATKNQLPAVKVIGEAKNGYEAIAQSAQLHPDVVLMDLEMPVLDGYEATRQIKASQPGIRVVILTIHDGPEEQQRAVLAGADRILTKGCGIDDLLAAINKNNPITNLHDQIIGGEK